MVLTKSGTNQFHGSVFEFFRDKNFNATIHLHPSKIDYNQHRFGGTVGGPVLHYTLFFFFSFAGFRYISHNLLNPTLPRPPNSKPPFSHNPPPQTTPPHNH